MQHIKQLLALISLFLISSITIAQNTFPPTGSVGIGTTTPGSKLSVAGDIHGLGMIGGNGSYYNVLNIPALENAPAYFYINTNIPATDAPATQLHITGYMYSNGANRAMKVTLGWYYFGGEFYWTQYQSDLGYNKPARIRLGKYMKDGMGYVRVEIANNSVYWSNYSISATDRADAPAYYKGWTYAEGEMPTVTTTQITTVEQHKDVAIDGKVDVSAADGSTISLSNTDNLGNGSSLGAINFYSKDPSGVGAQGVLSGIYGFAGAGTFDGTPTLPAGYLSFYTKAESNTLAEKMRITETGYVGIGYTSPTEKLSVNGNIKANGEIRSKKVTVTATGWPDYVFHPSYKLKPLSEIAQFIKQNQHLPGVPSAKEVEEKGINIGDNQALLLKKIEELTLYMIDMKNEIGVLKKENQDLRKEIHAKR